MKKIYFLLLCALAMTSCQESLQDRAEREAKEYTKKYCPMVKEEQVLTLDSLTFEKSTSTFIYYYTVIGASADQDNINKNKDKIRNNLIMTLHDDTSQKTYKDAGFSYRHIMISQIDGSVLFDTTLKKENY